MEVEGPTRSNGRSALHLRTMMCERAILQQADGSAEWVQEETCVVAAVYGPHQTISRLEHPERAVISVNFQAAVPGSQDKRCEALIQQTLSGVVLIAMHPRTQITVVVQVVHDDGGVLACAFNAACAALVDAGIPMRHLFVATSVALTLENVLLVDPDAAETKAAQAVVTLAFSAARKEAGKSDMSVSRGVLSSIVTGQGMDTYQFMASMELARSAAARVADLARLSLEKSLSTG